jgi:putative acetyltransferase
MAEPTVTLFVARDADGRAVGMGALKEHGDGLGEVKRMYTLPEIRGERIGSQLLQRIEATAREKGLSLLVLETGEAPGFEAAWRVYERGGFSVRGAVLDYPDSGYSRFYEKKLIR